MAARQVQTSAGTPSWGLPAPATGQCQDGRYSQQAFSCREQGGNGQPGGRVPAASRGTPCGLASLRDTQRSVGSSCCRCDLVPQVLLPSFLEPLDRAGGWQRLGAPDWLASLTETSWKALGIPGGSPQGRRPLGARVSRLLECTLGRAPLPMTGWGAGEQPGRPVGPSHWERAKWAEAGLCTPVRVWGRPRGRWDQVNRAVTTGQQGSLRQN